MLGKAVECRLQGRKVYLAYTLNAMFDINEYLGERELMEVLGRSGREYYPDFCAVLCILAENGELCRRAQGYDAGAMLTKEELAATNLTPKEYLDTKNQAIRAVLLGLGRELQPEDEEIDLGLAELEKNGGRPEQAS